MALIADLINRRNNIRVDNISKDDHKAWSRSESETYLRRNIGLGFEPEIESAHGSKVKMMTLCLFQN